MSELYNAHNNPAIYLQPPPPGEQPLPTAFLSAIQTWRTRLAHHPHRQRTLRERLVLPAAAVKQNAHSKLPREQDAKAQWGTPPPKQRRLSIGGLLNPDTAKRPMEILNSDVAKVMAQHENEGNILVPKENPLPHIYPGNGHFINHKGLGCYPSASVDCSLGKSRCQSSSAHTSKKTRCIRHRCRRFK